jgi:hypothetical protein
MRRKEHNMRRYKVEMAITGDEVSPEAVSLGELADVLSRLDRTLASYVTAKEIDLPPGAKVSLVDIERGSEQLVLSVAQPYLPAFADISRAVSLEVYDELPEPTYAELQGLSAAVVKRGWGLEIKENAEHGIYAARLGGEGEALAPRAPVHLEGTTTLHARCLRVGGVQPRAELRVASRPSLLHADLSEELARELATKLYEEVTLEGRATWDADTWEIEAFRVLRVTSYRRTDPVLAFKELAEAAEGRWDDADAVEYVRSLRADA